MNYFILGGTIIFFLLGLIYYFFGKKSIWHSLFWIVFVWFTIILSLRVATIFHRGWLGPILVCFFWLLGLKYFFRAKRPFLVFLLSFFLFSIVFFIFILKLLGTVLGEISKGIISQIKF